MTQPVSLNQLWHSVEPTQAVFAPEQIVHLPEVGQRYLKHAITQLSRTAIAPGAKLARAVRLRMQGEIKLKQWQRFQSEEDIS